MNPHAFQSFGEQCMVCGNGFAHPLHTASAEARMPQESFSGPDRPRTAEEPPARSPEPLVVWCNCCHEPACQPCAPDCEYAKAIEEAKAALAKTPSGTPCSATAQRDRYAKTLEKIAAIRGFGGTGEAYRILGDVTREAREVLAKLNEPAPGRSKAP